MVCLFSGTPRSGKSLDSIRYIISRSRRGKPVITNFPCNLSKYKKSNFTYCPNEQLTPRFLIRYAQEYWGTDRVIENDILLVIDEAQLLFPAIGTRMQNRMEWLRFFTLHGKLGYHIILITQNDRMIDRQIRGVIEYEYIHRKLNNFGARGILLRLVTMGKQYIVVQRWYPIKQTISQEFFSGNKRLYSIYDSYVLFSADKGKKIEDPQENPSESSSEVLDAPKQPKVVILWRSVFASVLPGLASLGLFLKSCICSDSFLDTCTRILSHRIFRVKWKRKRGRYQRRWRPFAKLSRWFEFVQGRQHDLDPPDLHFPCDHSCKKPIPKTIPNKLPTPGISSKQLHSAISVHLKSLLLPFTLFTATLYMQ